MIKTRHKHFTTNVLGQVALQEDPILERSFRGHKGTVTAVSFKPTMTQLASSAEDNTVMVWNFKPQLRAYRFVGHKAAVTSVDFAPHGQLLASSSKDKTVRLWSPTVKGDVTVFQAHTSPVRSVQFSSDGQMLISASEDKSIKIWSTYKTKFNGTLSGHANWVRTAKFSPDSRLVISGSDDKTVRLWDLRTKKCIKTYTDHHDIVSSVAFHPSGTVFASGSDDHSIKLFDIRMHTLIQHYSDAHVGTNSTAHYSKGVNSVAFGGAAAEWLVSTGGDGLVKVWDIKEGHLTFTVHAHKEGPTTCAEFSPDQDFFATAGVDSVIMVWRANFTYVPETEGSETGRSSAHQSIMEKSITAKTEESIVLEAESNRIKHTPKSNLTKFARHSTHEDANVHEKSESNDSESANSAKQPSVETTTNKQSQRHTSSSLLQEESINIMKSELTDAVDKIVNQINILTQTMAIMEDRLTMNEDRVENIDSKLNTILERLDQLKHVSK